MTLRPVEGRRLDERRGCLGSLRGYGVGDDGRHRNAAPATAAAPATDGKTVAASKTSIFSFKTPTAVEGAAASAPSEVFAKPDATAAPFSFSALTASTGATSGKGNGCL